VGGFSDRKYVQLLIFSVDGLSIPFFSIGRKFSRNGSVTRTLMKTPDWLVGTNRNPGIQSNQSNKEAAAVTIDMHEYPEVSTPQKVTEANRECTPSVSILKGPDTTLEEVRVEKQTTTPNSSNLDSRVVEAVNSRTVHISTV
jgi:hypothetical protein